MRDVVPTLARVAGCLERLRPLELSTMIALVMARLTYEELDIYDMLTGESLTNPPRGR